jgi:hypothetical protein
MLPTLQPHHRFKRGAAEALTSTLSNLTERMKARAPKDLLNSLRMTLARQTSTRQGLICLVSCALAAALLCVLLFVPHARHRVAAKGRSIMVQRSPHLGVAAYGRWLERSDAKAAAVRHKHFTALYEKNDWNKGVAKFETRAGPGSTLEYTRSARAVSP